MSANESNRLFKTSLVVFTATTGLLIVGYFLTPYRLWAVNTYGFLPWPFLGFPVLVGLALPLLLYRWVNKPATAQATPSETPSVRRYWQVVAIGAALSLAAWYLLRSHTHFLSDGYLILTRVALSDPPTRPWLKPAYAVLDFLASLSGNRAQGGALVAYEVIAFAAGLIVWLGAAFAAGRLFGLMRPRLMFVLGFALGGYALLYFGFVSNFALFLAMLALFGLTGLMAVRRKLSPIWPVVPLAVAGWLHPLAVCMLPALLYVWADATPLGSWSAGRGRRIAQGALAVVVLALAAVIYHWYTTDYFVRFLFVPVVPDRFTVEGYWLFSGKHLLDYVNLLLQVAPVVPLLVVLLVYRSSVPPLERSVRHYLLWLSVPPLLVAFLLDPKLGMPRGWDMFALVGLPLTLAAFYRLASADLPSRRMASVAILGIALSVLMLIPRVGVQVTPESAIVMFDRYSDLDFQKNASGRYVLTQYLQERGRVDDIRSRRAAYAERGGPASRRATDLMRTGNDSLAVIAMRDVVRENPIFTNAWINLGLSYYNLEKYDSAAASFRIADALNPYTARILNSLALTYYKLERPDLAEKMWLRSLECDPYNTEAFSWLIVAYELAERPADQQAMEARLLQAASDSAAPASLIGRAAKLHLDQHDLAAARDEYRRALAAGLDSAEVRAIQRYYPELEVLPDGAQGQ